MKRKMWCRGAGFTLIEVMIVVLILAVLSAIAIPSYRQYVITASRAQARTAMLNALQLEERWFTNNNTYLAIAAASASSAIPSFSGSDDFARRRYDITVAAGASGSIATSFTVTATPSNGFSDATCGTLTIDNLGTKTSSAGTVADCWK